MPRSFAAWSRDRSRFGSQSVIAPHSSPGFARFLPDPGRFPPRGISVADIVILACLLFQDGALIIDSKDGQIGDALPELILAWGVTQL